MKRKKSLKKMMMQIVQLCSDIHHRLKSSPLLYMERAANIKFYILLLLLNFTVSLMKVVNSASV